MTKLNDPTVVHDGFVLATTITQEGMKLYAVVYIDGHGREHILRTAMDERIALTMLQQEIYKLSQLKDTVNEADEDIEL